MLDKDRISIILKEYENQNEWERHNETQRAQLATILLIISSALIAWISDRVSDPNFMPGLSELPTPVLLVAIGLLGVLVILKYWERFLYHVDQEDAYREVLDSYFAPSNAQSKIETNTRRKYLFIKTREKGMKTHDEKRLLRDKYIKQHWLWVSVFVIIIFLGGYLALRAIGIA